MSNIIKQKYARLQFIMRVISIIFSGKLHFLHLTLYQHRKVQTVPI